MATASVGAAEPSQIRVKKIFDSCCIGNFAGLNQIFETKRVRVSPRGEKAIGKLEQAQKIIHVDGPAYFQSD